jgi:hypothetical protein
MTAGQLAALLEVDQRTIHNWVERGLLSTPEKTLGGQFRFDPAQVKADYVRRRNAVPEALERCVSTGVFPPPSPKHKLQRLTTEELRAELARRDERGAA